MSLRNISDVEALLGESKPKIRELHNAWSQRRPIYALGEKKSRYGSSDSAGIPWLEDSSLAKKFVSHALQAKEFPLVIDAAREILRGWEAVAEEDRTDLIRVRMDYADALTHLGATKEARRQLDPCMSAALWPMVGTRLKADILVQFANVLREASRRAAFPAEQILYGKEARQFYTQALEIDRNRLDIMVWSASLALLPGPNGDNSRAEAHQMARDILERTSQVQQEGVAGRQTTWARASAHAILADFESAHQSFGLLQDMDGAETTYLADVRFEAKFLAEAQGKPQDFYKSAFPPLQLIVFAGHLPDLPQEGGRPAISSRFPPADIPAAREALRAKLKEMKARVGLASGCAGADLLFAEAIEDMRGTLNLVLPWSQDEFRRTSVLPFEEAEKAPVWKPLFDRALACAATTREIGEVYKPDSDLGWKFMMEVSAGIALHTASAFHLDIKPMVFWDGLPGRGAGGTSAFHDFWKRKMGIDAVVVRPPTLSTRIQSRGSGGSESEGCQTPTIHQEVKSMLFADIVGYSKLKEKAIPAYIGIFLKRLSQLATSSKHAPCNVNTWGDALYAVFDFALDAGLFALEMSQMIQDGREDWLREGLFYEMRSDKDGEIRKYPLNVRIGLHTGPVVMLYDPVVQRLSYTGAHVTRAARIEPIAQPGQIFTSEEFAAMVGLSARIAERGSGSDSETPVDAGFTCEYAGSMPLAKGYPGQHRMYRLVRTRRLDLEKLAKAAHVAFCAVASNRVGTPATSLLPWEELSEDLKEANRAQVANIPIQLRSLGLELASGQGIPAAQVVITEAQMEDMARQEHDRWMEERRSQGWSYGSPRDNALKLHPSIVDWSHLPESEKEKDRDVIRNIANLIEKAGLKVIPIE